MVSRSVSPLCMACVVMGLLVPWQGQAIATVIPSFHPIATPPESVTQSLIEITAWTPPTYMGVPGRRQGGGTR